MVNAHARITGDAWNTINLNVLELCKLSFFLTQFLADLEVLSHCTINVFIFAILQR